MEKCILSGWIGACTSIWRPLLRLTTAIPPHAFPLLHFLSCFNIHHRLHLAFLGHSFDITFPLQIFNYFPTDHQVNFKFLNSEFNDFQNGTHLQLHPLLIPPSLGIAQTTLCTLPHARMSQAGQGHPFSIPGFYTSLLKSACHSLAWAHRKKKLFIIYETYVFYTHLQHPIP